MIAFCLYAAYGKRALALIMYDFDGHIYCATSDYNANGFIQSWMCEGCASSWWIPHSTLAWATLNAVWPGVRLAHSASAASLLAQPRLTAQGGQGELRT